MPSKKNVGGWDHRGLSLPKNITRRTQALGVVAKAAKAEPDFQTFLGPVHLTPEARRTNDEDV